MQTGYLTPLLDMFKRGQVDRDTKLMAVQSGFSLRPDEQRGLLEFLASDEDPEIARIAAASLEAATAKPEPPEAEGKGEEQVEQTQGVLQTLAAMNPAQRLGRAIKGTRSERAILIRDPNKVVALAVLSSPRLSEAEVEAIAKMANVSDEVLRVIGNTRAWVKSYRVVAALTRNPKTPLALSMNLMSRLTQKDIKLLMADRNVPDVLRLAARRKQSPKR